MTSLFTKIIAGELPGVFVYQDETVVAFMDIFPFNPGHVLVVPRQEKETLDQLDPAVAANMMLVAQKICTAIRASDIPADALKLMLNDGPAAGQEIPHAHLHIQPRLFSDRGRPRRTPEIASPDDLELVAIKIRNALATH